MRRIPSIFRKAVAAGVLGERKARIVSIFLLLILGLVCVPLCTLGFVYAQKQVKVNVDSQILHMKTSAKDVNEVLHQAGIVLDQDDRVYPGRNTQIKDGMTIKVQRVKVKLESKRAIIPYRTERRKNDQLASGTLKVVQQGSNGIKTKLLKVTYIDGKAVKRQVVEENITKQPVNKVVMVGSKAASVKTSRGALRYKKVLMMNASAYAPDPRCTGKVNSRTASGMQAGPGVVAVDPGVIPLRTRLFIEGYGFAVAGDTGSSIKGNKIDLCYSTYEEALRFGRRMVKVYILQ